jgi:hypothetical protein
MVGDRARPKNETEKDLEIEAEAMEQIRAKWSAKNPIEILKLQPHVYGVDWAIMRNGTLHSWGEFKRRYKPLGGYPTLDIGLGKWMRLKWNAERSLVPFAIYVRWGPEGKPDEDLYYCSWPHMTAMTYPLGTLRRKDRGQAGDTEPCIRIPLSEFKKL